MEKCRKKAARKSREDDPGGEAMEMMLLKSKRTAEAKARKAAEGQAGKQPSATNDADADEPWKDDP